MNYHCAWELDSQWTPKTSESDCKGKNPSPWRGFYTIAKILKRRCPNWARMTHLDIYNTSYGQKKGRESNCQFDSRPQKVKNRPNSLACKWHGTRSWKALNKGNNFSLDLIPIGGLHKKLWTRKVAGVPTLAISGLPFSGQKAIWMALPWGGVEYIIWGKVVASPKFGPWWVLWVRSHMWFVLAPKVP
jgi:hypothetical protein